MAVDYSLPKPVAGTSRATSPTETEILGDISDTIADIDTRLDTLEAAPAGGSTLFSGPMPPGLWVPTGSVAQNVGTNHYSNNTLYLTPFVIGRDCTVNGVGIYNFAAGNGGSILRPGIYSDNGNGYPGTLLNDIGTTGTFAMDAAGVKSVAFSQAVTAGIYWVGGAIQSAGTTTPAPDTSMEPPSPPIASSTVTPAALGSYVQTGVSGALPGTFTATVATFSHGFRLFVRAA